MVATASKEEIQNYWDVPGDQDAGTPELLPTNPKKGAPEGALYLLQMGDDDVTLKHSESDSNPGHPYIEYYVSVLSPEEFTPEEYPGGRFRGMFWFPVVPEDTDDTKAMKVYGEQMKKIIGQVDGILGERTVASLDSTELEARLEELVGLRDGASFVGEMGKEPAKGGFRAKNRINKFFHSDTWNEAGE